MNLSRIAIKNFRNFKKLDVQLSEHAVVVGENKVGKSNLLHGVRLLLDPSLPNTARFLREEDFWDGLKRPLSKDDRILISIEFSNFEANEMQFADLGDFLVKTNPIVARLTYVFQPKATLKAPPTRQSDYEYFIYGGNDPENKVYADTRERIPLDLLQALRDAEGDLLNWRRSPLRPLLEKVSAGIGHQELEAIADDVSNATKAVVGLDDVKALVKEIVIVYRVDWTVKKFKLDKSCPLGYVRMDESRRIPPS